MPTQERSIGTTGENNVEKRIFVVDKVYNGVDLSTLTPLMEVVPINLDSKSYFNFITAESKSEKLYITWEVKAHDLVNSGKLYFDLKFVQASYVSTGSEEYITFQTDRDYFVITEDAISATDPSAALPPSAIEQSIAKATAQANIAISAATTATQQAAAVSMQTGTATEQAVIATTQAEIATTQAKNATEKSNIATTQASIATQQAVQAKTAYEDMQTYIQDQKVSFKGDKGDKGDQGIQGERGERGDSGILNPTNGFFTLHVDGYGDLIATVADGASQPPLSIVDGNLIYTL